MEVGWAPSEEESDEGLVARSPVLATMAGQTELYHHASHRDVQPVRRFTKRARRASCREPGQDQNSDGSTTAAWTVGGMVWFG